MFAPFLRYQHLSEPQWRAYRPHFVPTGWPAGEFDVQRGIDQGQLPGDDQEEIKFTRPVESELDIVMGATVNVLRPTVKLLKKQAIACPQKNRTPSQPLIRFVRGSTVVAAITALSGTQTLISFRQVPGGIKHVYLDNDEKWQHIMEDMLSSVLRHSNVPSKRCIVTDYNHWGLIEFQSVTSGSVPYRIRWVKYEENNHDEIRSMVYTFVSTARYLDSQQHLLDTMKFFVDQYRIMEKRINGTALHGSYRDLKRFSPTALSRRRYDDLPKLPKFLDYLHHTIEMEEVPADELCDCGPLGLRIHNQLAAGDRVSTRLVRVAGTDGPLFVEKIYDSDEKFEKEMSIYRKLSHLQGTTIPYLHSVLVTDPFVTHLGVRRPGALFEYCCEAMLLKEWWDKPIAARSLPPSELRHRMQQVVVASVETLHGEGIAHTQLIDHLLVRPSDLQVTIISFTHCQSDRQSLDRDWIDLEALFSGSSSTMSQRSSLPTPFTRPHSGLAQWHPAKPISPT